ncbi:tetratricopeptide repeat protein [Mucilaginibacter mali]|uniref:Tetratricopeptide repeat protein n=1 Tax=Mucilaginibacter mali TaxID=2740462 RepID=A0A7D4Q4B0_9SPHI|nr:tetratricopeptide repeat protein [Mucilaginibacter mali]QKJ32866.1 tetratricopeptide repeat protein [Mucilaginibacter mali]
MFEVDVKQIAFFKLFDDLIEMLLETKNLDRNKLSNKQLADFSFQIQSELDWEKACSVRTLKKYIEHGFSSKDYYKNQLAAVWLYHSKEGYDLDVIRRYLKNNRISDSRYWDAYLKKFTIQLELEHAMLESVKHAELESLKPFALRRFNHPFRRKSYYNALEDARGKNKVVFIEGSPKTGKTFIVSDFLTEAIEKGVYRRVLWTTCDDNYTLTSFLGDFSREIYTLKSPTDYGKITEAFEYIREKDFIAVFDDFEKANLYTFLDFLNSFSHFVGLARLFIIQRKNEKLNVSTGANKIEITPFDRLELTELLKTKKFPIVPAIIQDILTWTTGLPYFIMQYLNKIGIQEDINDLYKKPLNFTTMERQVSEIIERINESENELLRILCVLNEPFKLDTLLFFTNEINYTFADDTIHKLYQENIIQTIGAGFFELSGTVREFLLPLISIENKVKYHALSGKFLLSDNKESNDSDSDGEVAKRNYKAITHFQQAGNFKLALSLIKSKVALFKSNLMYSQLDVLLRNQRDNQVKSQIEPFYYDIWLDYHLAHAAFIAGRFDEGVDYIYHCLDRSLKMKPYDLRNQDCISFFIKSFQLYSDYLDTLIDHQIARQVLEHTLALFKPRELEWNLRLHAISLLSGYFILDGEFEKALEINENTLQDAIILSQQIIGVAHIRIGMIYLKQKDNNRAVSHLQKAHDLLIAFGDRRAALWSARYLAKGLYRKGDLKDFSLIRGVLETCSEANLNPPDYLSWLNYFRKEPELIEFVELFERERERVTQLIAEKKNVAESKKVKEKAAEYISILKNKAVEGFSYKSYAKPFENNAIKIDSLSVTSFSNKVQKVAVPYFESLFKRKSIESIFSYHLNNAIIKDCLLLGEKGKEIMDRFIFPNLAYLKNDLTDPADSIRMLYARTFEAAGETNAAFEMLSIIKPENYPNDFFNIKANCYSREGNFEKAYECYQSALEFSNDDAWSKGKIYNNIAHIIIKFRKEHLYQEGISSCLAAMEERKDDRFIIHPITNLFILTTETTTTDQIEKVIGQLIKRYRITYRELQKIVPEILSEEKKDIIKNLFVS